MPEGAIENPILNGPYQAPTLHFEIAEEGGITGTILTGRRPSESFIPIAPTKKGRKNKAAQVALDFDATGERREQNTLINDIRQEVELWRLRQYPGVTPYTRKLLQYWANPDRDNPVLFCQREAAETAIYMAEVAGRQGADFRRRIDPENQLHNDGLPRVGLKMATGAGKTVVMAMLIAWQTTNKVMTPRDARFAKRFLIVAPGITIRDRLRVLYPGDEGNYFRERDLVPADLWGAVQQAEIIITNWHGFSALETKEFKGVAKLTKQVLKGDKKGEPFTESPDQIVSRVLRGWGRGEIVVLNDEAHHCYRDRPLEAIDEELDGDDRKEAKDRNEGARVWFRGLQAIRKKVGIKTVYDLSATPFYLKGSGYNEGYIFPWVVSDFSLMDAIESGIVKVPRTPVDDDAAGAQVAYLHLWDHVGTALPKRKAKEKKVGEAFEEWAIPATLESAIQSLYRSYERAYRRWEESLADLGEPPPVFIVVCPNTVVSKLVFDYVAGLEVPSPDGETVRLRPGKLPLFSNVNDNTGQWLHRPNTIIVDSVQLESGDAMNADYKATANVEIDAFKAEYRNRNPGADIDKLTDEDLLREVMNTVGKQGKLGEGIRCVVSVSMLTEGWDANTVTHILGIRRFGSQLLCEQVVGRGLRRRSYAIDPETGHFDAEYAEVYGVPFNFISADKPVGPDKPKVPSVHVRALDERAHLEIAFPIIDGYRMEIPDPELLADFSDTESKLHVDKETVALWTRSEGIAGEGENHTNDNYTNARVQEVAFGIAETLVKTRFQLHGDTKPWLFPQLVSIAKNWLGTCVTYEPGCTVGLLKLSDGRNRAAEAIFTSVIRYGDSRGEYLLPRTRRWNAEGSTADVSFFSRKKIVETVEIAKSHVNHVVLDGIKGNSWEERLTELLEANPDVFSYVKNDHLGFTIPYVHKGTSHIYVPDFLVRLTPEPDDEIVRTLIVEVSGSLKEAGLTAAKASAAREQWCPAVNNAGQWGRWGYAEITDPKRAGYDLSEAIANLRADGPITGLHE